MLQDHSEITLFIDHIRIMMGYNLPSAASEANEAMKSHDLVEKGEKRIRAMYRAKVSYANPGAS